MRETDCSDIVLIYFKYYWAGDIVLIHFKYYCKMQKKPTCVSMRCCLYMFVNVNFPMSKKTLYNS
jgi:hypothetical protein